MSNYVRVKRGRMIHLAECSFGRTGTPWLWAQGLERGRLELVATLYNLKLCKRCLP